MYRRLGTHRMRAMANRSIRPNYQSAIDGGLPLAVNPVLTAGAERCPSGGPQAAADFVHDPAGRLH
jgi:hypothetical protein